MRSTEVPNWVTFPGSNWEAITPGDAGLDQEKFQRFLASLNARGASVGGDACTSCIIDVVGVVNGIVNVIIHGTGIIFRMIFSIRSTTGIY